MQGYREGWVAEGIGGLGLYVAFTQELFFNVVVVHYFNA